MSADNAAHPALARHVAAAVQRHGRRGWRLDRASRSPDDSIDGLVALAMALERAEHRPEPVRLVGWLQQDAPSTYRYGFAPG